MGDEVREQQEALLSLLYAPAVAERNFLGASCDYLAHQYGAAGDRPVRRRAYPANLTDTQWALGRESVHLFGGLQSVSKCIYLAIFYNPATTGRR